MYRVTSADHRLEKHNSSSGPLYKNHLGQGEEAWHLTLCGLHNISCEADVLSGEPGQNSDKTLKNITIFATAEVKAKSLHP